MRAESPDTQTPMMADTAPFARDAIRRLGASRIREVANEALGDPTVLPFWFGEPDEVTAAFIRDAAKAALDAGDTFYHHNLGLPVLREALARYQSGLHGPLDAGRIVVTSSGVNALMLAAQSILSPGDRVVAVVPLWPNVTEIPAILGARVERIPLALEHRHWTLDIDRLLAAITPATRAVIVNSPNNPTGWVMPAGQMRALQEHCRARGVWIISDEAYERLVFDGSRCAASMLDAATDRDRLIVANTFSKTWQMTGWRLGWLTAPAELVPDLAKLIEFNTSCAPGFIQQAGLAALRGGEAPIHQVVATLGHRRDAMVRLLGELPEIDLGVPDGAMYAFLRVKGQDDSLALAKRLVHSAKLGLAPGVAFGPEGEGFLRWCFARPEAQLADGVDRLKAELRGRGRLNDGGA